MKIKNEYIKIKTNQEVVLHNYIYDEYLKGEDGIKQLDMSVDGTVQEEITTLYNPGSL